MKKQKLLYCLPLLLLISNFAGAQLKARVNIQTKIANNIYFVSIPEGYHFNDEAPNRVTVDQKIIPVSKISKRNWEFRGLPSQWKEGTASLFVCDDALTFCEPQKLSLKPGSVKEEKSAPIVPAVKHKNGKTNKHGFIEDDFTQALEKARKEKKLLLVDFSARWCPGCLRYENETFDTSFFKDLTKKYVKVKMDVDRFENQVVAKKFQLRGIPTLLVVTPNQEEVDRLIDYQANPVLQKFFASITEDPSPVVKLAAEAKSKDPVILQRIVSRLVSSGRYQESLIYAEQMNPRPLEYLSARVEAARIEFEKDPKKKDAYIQVLKDVISKEGGSSRSLVWRTALVEQLSDQKAKEKVKDEGVKVADRILQMNPADLQKAIAGDLVGEYTGYEAFLVSIERADLVEASGAEEAEVVAAWQKSAAIGKSYKTSLSQVGPALRYLIILMQAKLYTEADQLSAELLKKQPDYADLQRRRLKALVEVKKYPEAIKIGKKSLGNSYGRNEFWVAESLAKAYIGNKDYKSAQTLLAQYLSRSEMQWENMQATKKSLEDLQKQAQH